VAKKKAASTSQAPQRRKKRGYTPGEWFMVGLGLALVIMFAVIIVTSIFDL
jgi:hypothetical protein